MLSNPHRFRAATAALLLLATGAALAGPTFPPRKAGLWEMRISMADPKAAGKEGGVFGGDGMVMQHCVDAATDKAMQEMGDQPVMNRKFCKEEMRNEAGKLLVHQSVCKGSTGTVTTRVVISGDFDTQYRVQSNTTTEPPQKGKPSEDMVMNAKWKGACAAGQRPGDMVMPGGMKMNIMDAMAARPKK